MEGQHVEKKPGIPGKGPIIAAVVAGVLAAAYLGLCAWVGSLDVIFPNTSLAGLDVSGMTVEQAQEEADRLAEEGRDDISVTLSLKDWTGTVTAGEIDRCWQLEAERAWQRGREHFLTQGASYLACLMGNHQDVGLSWTSVEPLAVVELIDQAEDTIGGGDLEASYTLNGDRLELTKGVTCTQVDFSAAWPGICTALEQSFASYFSAGETDAAAQTVELPVVESRPQEPDFDQIYSELHAEAVSAQVDPETLAVSDHVVGVDFDKAALKAAYEGAAEGETVSVPVTITQPKDTKASLQAKLFRDLLGEGTTRVSGSANRKHNVKLSAQACNGVVLMPGEEFSYNDTTGSRSAGKGYLPAPVYSGGNSVDEVGGGICQTSSTIYYAVLHTALEVVERHAHTYNTGYVTQGMDATVYYGAADFRFKNNTEYPVKVVTQSYDRNGNRYLTVKIYGTNEQGVRAVPKSEVFDRVDPVTQYKADPSVPQGTTKVDTKQNAYIGWSARTYRYLYDRDGNQIEKQDMGFSKYKMRPKTILYNPADGDPATWVDGKPPQPGGTVDPGTNPEGNAGGQTEKPGGTTDPGTSPDTGAEGETKPDGSETPGTAPGGATGEENRPDVSTGQENGSGAASGSQTPSDEQTAGR